jgi:hypothetical protein
LVWNQEFAWGIDFNAKRVTGSVMKIRQLSNRNNSKVRDKEEQVELWIETSGPWMARKNRSRETRVSFSQGAEMSPTLAKLGI